MADQKKRSELLQEQIGRLMMTAPKPYTSEEIAQINKGRKTNAEMSEGRASIEKRNQEVREFNAQIERLNTQLDKATESEIGEARQAKQDDTKAKEREEKETVWGRAIQLAVGAPAVKAGYAVGDRLGEGYNRRADAGQAARNTVLKQIADDRVKGLTTREGALSGARRSGVLPSGNPLARVIPRGAAQLAGGAGALGLGVYDLATMNPNDPWVTSALRAGLGGAAVGAGAGIGIKSLERMANPKVPADGAALSIIESPQLRRAGLKGASEIDKGPISAAPEALPAPEKPAGPIPGSKEHLREQAKALGVKVTTRMSKQEIAEGISKAVSEAGGKRTRAPRLPKGAGAAGLGAALGYSLTPERAEAADGSGGGKDQTQALTNAGMAGAAGYGAKRLMDRAGPLAGAVMQGAGEAMAPMQIDSMTDWHDQPEQLQKLDQWGARNLPDWMTTGARNRLDMAQVPERNSMPRQAQSPFTGQGNDEELQAALEAFLAEAGTE